MKKIKKIFPFFIILFGTCLMAYPWISNWLYQKQADASSVSYDAATEDAGEDKLKEMLEAARAYNAGLATSQAKLTDPFIEEMQGKGSEYNSLLNLQGNGVMCYVEIPCIGVNLPVYHGTSTETLKRGAGHLQGSSLPVGGESTHAVITGHTGLNAAKLFTDLTEVEEGDLFFIKALGETLAYKVCDIQVVLPEEVESLYVQKGRDLVTLITCTPYGSNTHRLFVTGERTEYSEEVYESEKDNGGAPADSEWMRAYRNAALIGLCIALALILAMRLLRRQKGRKK